MSRCEFGRALLGHLLLSKLLYRKTLLLSNMATRRSPPVTVWRPRPCSRSIAVHHTLKNTCRTGLAVEIGHQRLQIVVNIAGEVRRKLGHEPVVAAEAVVLA